MIDLAIALDTDKDGTTIAETNCGKILKVPGWPQDSDFNILAFAGDANVAAVVWTEELVHDIAAAVRMLRDSAALKQRTPEWFRRLETYASAHEEA